MVNMKSGGIYGRVADENVWTLVGGWNGWVGGGELLFGYIYNLYSSRNYVTVRKLKIYTWVVYKIDMQDIRNSHDTASVISEERNDWGI